MNKRTVLIVIGVIVAVVGFLIFTQPTEEAAGTVSNHTVGAGTTGVTLVEYGDFQCPACGAYFPVLQQVKEHYGDQITFQFSHFPLESIHPNARAAARAAEAAGMQGKFWEMHDQLFSFQNEWKDTKDPISTFEAYANSIGVEDIERFKTDYRSSDVSATINADMKAGRELGVGSTPTFVLDGKKLDPNPDGSLESFIEVIDAAIVEKTGQQPDGTNDNEAENQESEPAKPEEESPAPDQE